MRRAIFILLPLALAVAAVVLFPWRREPEPLPPPGEQTLRWDELDVAITPADWSKSVDGLSARLVVVRAPEGGLSASVLVRNSSNKPMEFYREAMLMRAAGPAVMRVVHPPLHVPASPPRPPVVVPPGEEREVECYPDLKHHGPSLYAFKEGKCSLWATYGIHGKHLGDPSVGPGGFETQRVKFVITRRPAKTVVSRSVGLAEDGAKPEPLPPPGEQTLRWDELDMAITPADWSKPVDGLSARLVVVRSPGGGLSASVRVRNASDKPITLYPDVVHLHAAGPAVMQVVLPALPIGPPVPRPPVVVPPGEEREVEGYPDLKLRGRPQYAFKEGKCSLWAIYGNGKEPVDPPPGSGAFATKRVELVLTRCPEKVGAGRSVGLAEEGARPEPPPTPAEQRLRWDELDMAIAPADWSKPVDGLSARLVVRQDAEGYVHQSVMVRNSGQNPFTLFGGCLRPMAEGPAAVRGPLDPDFVMRTDDPVVVPPGEERVLALRARWFYRPGKCAVWAEYEAREDQVRPRSGNAGVWYGRFETPRVYLAVSKKQPGEK